MTCPVCDAALQRAPLLPGDGDAPDLRGFRCPNAHGLFLPSDLYFAWREGHEPVVDGGGLIPSPDAVGDVKKPKLCPQDGRIMGRYKVGAGNTFWLDRCATCSGVWFDGDEWEATVEAGLLDHLPSIVTDAWQRTIEDDEAASTRAGTLRDRLGADDLERIDAFRTWAWAHPERHVILARLGERPEAA